MRKALIAFIIFIIGFYSWGIASAFLLEKKSEEYIENTIVAISKPWNLEELETHSSWWMKSKSQLTPERIIDMAKSELGNLVKLNQKPDCYLQQGHDQFSSEKHTYAICSVNGQYQRKSALIKLRLIQEEGAWKINDFISIQ